MTGLTTYPTMFTNVEAYKPQRMSKAEAADLLRTLKYTTEMGSKMSTAIDMAIAALNPEIVPTVESLLQAVIRETGVTEEQMCERCRCREYSEARYIYFWLCHNYTSATHTAIGRRINRDHVMVYYGINRVDYWLERPKTNRQAHAQVGNIINRIVNNE